MIVKIICFLIYWAVSGLILSLVVTHGVEKPKLKDWLPTFIFAPLIFPFYMVINNPRYSSPVGGFFGTGRKKEEKKEPKKKK